jgi:hypothetical protein
VIGDMSLGGFQLDPTEEQPKRGRFMTYNEISCFQRGNAYIYICHVYLSC